MNLATYQAGAVSTAFPSALSHDYLIPGLISEVGELFGKRAKAVRDGWTEERLKAELVKEYGDICWMTAVALHIEGVSEPWKMFRLTSPSREWADLLDKTTMLGLIWMDGSERGKILGHRLLGIWDTLERMCLPITGSTFDVVLQANLDKLAGRSERGTLAGSGDER